MTFESIVEQNYKTTNWFCNKYLHEAVITVVPNADKKGKALNKDKSNSIAAMNIKPKSVTRENDILKYMDVFME